MQDALTDEAGIFEERGKLYHMVDVPVSGGETRQVKREVARSMQESRERAIDFYDPQRGWFLKGWKWQRDRPAEEVFADDSIGEAVPEEERSY
jgi:hypothetical protein